MKFVLKHGAIIGIATIVISLAQKAGYDWVSIFGYSCTVGVLLGIYGGCCGD